MSLPHAEFRHAVQLRLLELAEDLPARLKPCVLPFVREPGKGVRSALVAAAATGGTAHQGVLVRIGAVVELLHLASLIHDDVVDRAASRRGLPTVHEQVGPDMALLAGTACVAMVGQEAAELGPSTAAAVSGCTATLALGQMMDVERAYDTELTEAAYGEMVRKKTGALFELSCVLGAGFAGADGAFINAVAGFATEMGVCFQIQDDCKDFRPGSGKPAGTDHKLGLFSLPTLSALRTRPDLTPMLLAPEIDIDQIRRVVVDAGGLDHAVTQARRHRELAFEALGRFGDSPAGKALREVTDAVWTFS